MAELELPELAAALAVPTPSQVQQRHQRAEEKGAANKRWVLLDGAGTMWCVAEREESCGMNNSGRRSLTKALLYMSNAELKF
jgi:hypothetical protein